MTNGVAIVLALCIAAALTWDAWALDWSASLFLARKGLDLLQAIAVWR